MVGDSLSSCRTNRVYWLRYYKLDTDMVPPVSVLIVSAVPGVVDLNDKFCYSHQRDRKIPKNTHIGRSGFFFLNAPGFSLMSPRSAFRGGTMSVYRQGRYTNVQ